MNVPIFIELPQISGENITINICSITSLFEECKDDDKFQYTRINLNDNRLIYTIKRKYDIISNITDAVRLAKQNYWL